MTLCIRTQDNRIYSANVVCHFMVAEEYDISMESVIDTGFQTAYGIIIWRENSKGKEIENGSDN